MPGDAFLIRTGSNADIPAFSRLDSSISTEWVLILTGSGGQIEQEIGLRWERVEEGARRTFELDEEELAKAAWLVVAEVNGAIAGYLALRANWNRTAEIADVIVDAQHRRCGIGRRFVEEAEAFARERGLRAVQWEVQNDNRDAIEFAVARGFRIAGFHDAFYHNDDRERQLAPDSRGLALFLTKSFD